MLDLDRAELHIDDPVGWRICIMMAIVKSNVLEVYLEEIDDEPDVLRKVFASMPKRDARESNVGAQRIQ